MFNLDKINEPSKLVAVVTEAFYTKGINAFNEIETLITEFRDKYIDLNGNNKKYSRSAFVKELEHTLKIYELNQEKNIIDFFLGITTINKEDIDNIRQSLLNNQDSEFSLMQKEDDDIIYSSGIIETFSEYIKFSQDYKEHEFYAIIATFLEKMSTEDKTKLREEIKNNNVSIDYYFQKMDQYALIELGIIKEDNGSYSYKATNPGLPDAVFINPNYKNLHKVGLITVAATIDKETSIERHTLFTHSVATYATLKQLHNALYDRSFNKGYDYLMKIKEHFDNNESDLKIDTKMLLWNQLSFTGDTHQITYDNWKTIKDEVEDIIDNQGKLFDFCLDYRCTEIDQRITEVEWMNEYAKLKNYNTWENYIKNKASHKNFANTLNELSIGNRGNDKANRISEKEMAQLAKQMKVDGMESFFIGDASFKNRKDAPDYYKNNKDFTPEELRLGINIAAYAAEIGGFHRGFEIKNEAAVTFLSHFEIRANIKRDKVDGKKIKTNFNKINEFLINEYINKDENNIMDNMNRESDYVYNNILKFKTALFHSVVNIIDDNPQLSLQKAFNMYIDLLGVKNVNISFKDFFHKEKELNDKGYTNKDNYFAFKLLEKTIALRKKDNELKEQENNFKKILEANNIDYSEALKELEQFSGENKDNKNKANKSRQNKPNEF